MPDQFQKGLNNIRAALDAAISDRAVADAVVHYSAEGSGGQSARFALSVGDRQESQVFSREEIEDSGQAIDAPVAMKVRLLVSHFVR